MDNADEMIAARGRRTRDVAKRLANAYGPRPWRRHLPPVDELIATILSQHTSDTNTARAFASLRARFPTWNHVIAASDAEVADAIRTGGLANIKAPRIRSVLAQVLESQGSFDLDHLAGMPVDTARKELTALHGIGPKTASCVLLFSLGMPAMPVDTHVHRVTGRLGLLPPRTSAESAHGMLERQLGGDRDAVYAFHMHLIHHGRTVCLARRPLCERCTIREDCDYVDSHPGRAA